MVNVTDFDSPIPPGDMLDIIFTHQQALIDKYHPIEEKNAGHPIPAGVLDLDNPPSQQRLKDFAWRVTEEIGEAMNCLKNKPWKQTHMKTDAVHYREELVDALHFFVELLIYSGFTPETVTKMYLNKNAVNQFRIGSKY